MDQAISQTVTLPLLDILQKIIDCNYQVGDVYECAEGLRFEILPGLKLKTSMGSTARTYQLIPKNGKES